MFRRFRSNSYARGPLAVALYVAGTAGMIHADVAISSGSIYGSYGFCCAPGNVANLTGDGFVLAGRFGQSALAWASVSSSSATFSSNPGSIEGILTNSNLHSPLPGTVVYNGVTYDSPFVSVKLVVPVVTVPFQVMSNGRIASVSNLPFSMTGTLKAGSVTIPIYGFGYFSAYYTDISQPGGGLNVAFDFTPYDPSQLDPATHGAWNGKYGGDGYLIANGATRLPAWATVSVTGASTYTWAAQTADPRALQNGAGSTTGIASAFTQYPGNSYNININITDGNSHQVALYLLDWDSTTRSENVTVTDVLTNTVLDSRQYSGFANGVYAVWTLKGNVKITVKPNIGLTPVVSGIFFGYGLSSSMPAPALASVAYGGYGSAPQGLWTGKFGANGYMIANGASQPPAYGIASVTGAIAYTWAGQTTDVRALQSAPGSSMGIASAYTQYPGNSFTINVNVADGNSHNISLYMLDWDSAARAQTITITDASTNTMLDTQTFSGFHDGLYASWNIKGNVVIKVTPVGTTSPVVSGVFFN